jgi:hypothetical protein
MNIKKVKTAKKVGEFILRNDNHRNFIGFEYENNIQPILDNEDGRVYLFSPKRCNIFSLKSLCILSETLKNFKKVVQNLL